MHNKIGKGMSEICPTQIGGGKLDRFDGWSAIRVAKSAKSCGYVIQ
jgi:hypothetical protein